MNNLDITPQMALYAAIVLKEYCSQNETEDTCVFGCCADCMGLPEEWNLPEMEDSHE